MAVKKKRGRRRKRVRYHTVKLKLSAGQKESLDLYCKVRGTTRNKLIKKVLKKYLGFTRGMPEENFATANQLDLFESGHA